MQYMTGPFADMPSIHILLGVGAGGQDIAHVGLGIRGLREAQNDGSNR